MSKQPNASEKEHEKEKSIDNLFVINAFSQSG